MSDGGEEKEGEEEIVERCVGRRQKWVNEGNEAVKEEVDKTKKMEKPGDNGGAG